MSPHRTTKVCTKCGLSKSLSEYYVKVKATGRLQSRCKTCHNALKQARYHAQHPDKRPLLTAEEKRTRKAVYRAARAAERKAYNDAYRKANADRVRASSARYRAENHETVIERQRVWRLEHPERHREISHKTKAKHADKRRAYNRAHRLANPDLSRARYNRRRARIKGNGGSYTAAEWQALKENYGYRCLCCGQAEPDITLSVDHVVPIKHGGMNVIANIQPLCLLCNSRKSTKTIDYRPKEC